MDGAQVRASGCGRRQGEFMTFDSIVLAAGKGTRMKSSISKVLHDFAGRKIVYFPVRAALECGATRAIVVCSPDNRESIARYLEAEFGKDRIVCVVQTEQLGTGDAARAGMIACQSEQVCLLCGDTPLVDAAGLELFTASDGKPAFSVMSCHLDDPTGYGRILRDGERRVVAIREQRDASSEERRVTEVNAGIYFGDTAALRGALAALRCDNDQKEYYLTDVVAILSRTSQVEARLGSPDTLLGINDREQLEVAEQKMLSTIRTRHRRDGVTVRGDARIEDAVEIGRDSVIESGVQLRGKTQVGSGTHIDVGSVLTNVTVGSNAQIRPYTTMTECELGNAVQIGPYAHLRPGSIIEDEAHIGNFVETKKTRMRRGAKANHLAYLGDGDVGEKANIGAGTIFCNYDGYRKHQTTIGAGAFIGSDSQLVAPVEIGSGAYVATGTTVTSDVPDDAVAIGRTPQVNKPGSAARLRRRLAAAVGKKA